MWNNLIWMSQNTFDDKSTLVQVMAWCHQATSHYLNQCWHRSMLLYGITRPLWVNTSYADFFWGNMKIHLHFLSFLETAKVQEICALRSLTFSQEILKMANSYKQCVIIETMYMTLLMQWRYCSLAISFMETMESHNSQFFGCVYFCSFTTISLPFQGENPIYKQATSTFKNPTYAGKS